MIDELQQFGPKRHLVNLRSVHHVVVEDVERPTLWLSWQVDKSVWRHGRQFGRHERSCWSASYVERQDALIFTVFPHDEVALLQTEDRFAIFVLNNDIDGNATYG
jgi:hypothetical protein